MAIERMKRSLVAEEEAVRESVRELQRLDSERR